MEIGKKTEWYHVFSKSDASFELSHYKYIDLLGKGTYGEVIKA